MGKASIISEIGSGQYITEVSFDTSAAVAELSRLNNSLDIIDARLVEENGKDPVDVDVVAMLELRKLSVEKQIVKITESADMDYQTSAWCADLSTGLTGIVGTIEPAAEYKNGINIQPGYGGGSAWNTARDGQATPFLTMNLADAMRNFAIMPGIQKWRPTYRYAVISNLNRTANTCTVTLDAVTSSLGSLNVNFQTTFDGVDIDYMNCNAAAFEDGDAVIVKWSPYDSESDPKVIGFKDHPKGCYPILVVRCGSQYLAWDFTSEQIMNISGISQPTSLATLENALFAMGYTTRTDPIYESIGSGACDVWNPEFWGSYGEPDFSTWPYVTTLNETYPQPWLPWVSGIKLVWNADDTAYTDTDLSCNFLGSGEIELSDTGETFNPYYDETKTVVGESSIEYNEGELGWGEPQSCYAILTNHSELTEEKALEFLYAARLSHQSGEKRRPCFYFITGQLSYNLTQENETCGSMPPDRPVIISYEKKVSYKSTINLDNNSNYISTISGSCASYVCEYTILDDYNNNEKIAVAAFPSKALLKDELAFVIEQPVVYNEQTDSTWGLSKLYYTADGAKPAPTEDYAYEWDDLIELDTDKIFTAFGTTFSDEMATRHQSAGLAIMLYSTS